MRESAAVRRAFAERATGTSREHVGSDSFGPGDADRQHRAFIVAARALRRHQGREETARSAKPGSSPGAALTVAPAARAGPTVHAAERIRISAHIHTGHGRATLRVTLEDGPEQSTISWYVDEFRFTPQDAIGITVEELRQLHFQRDRAYLQA